MKRKLAVFGVGVLLLLSSTAAIGSKRIVSENKTTSVVEEKATLSDRTTEPASTAGQAATIPVFEFEATGVEVEHPTPEAALEPGAYEIPWQSINAGGDNLSSDNYQMMFSVGQSVVGYATSDNYEAGIGYWYGAGGTKECYCGVPGNVDNDGTTPTPLDVTLLVKKVYKSQDALYDYQGLGSCPFQNGDVDGSGGAPNPLDVTLLVKKVYKSQDALCVDRCNGTPGNCPGP